MTAKARLFYLAAFALLGSACSQRHDGDSTRATAGGPDVCAVEPSAIVSDACASFGTVDQLNDALSKDVRAVTKSTDFFSYYRLNLFSTTCPFWEDGNSMCGNRACAVETLENEEDIPEIWRTEELSKLRGPQAHHPSRKQQKEKQRPLDGNLTDEVSESCVVEYDDDCDDRDYCVPEDEGASAKGDYVSLVDNEEKFTGYSGAGAHMVWDAIYRENCFTNPEAPAISVQQPFGNAKASGDLRSIIHANAPPGEIVVDDTCVEKRVFYRIISGMHASISTHLCYNYLDQKTGTWGPNATCFQDRVGQHQERISNLYFNYGLLVRAVAKLQDYFKSYTFCTGDIIQDRDTKAKVLRVAETAAAAPTIFDESIMFADPTSALELKEDFRARFRNVSRLMDCVGCDKCRLWGKLQTAGYGTALKVLFEFDEAADFELKRTELVALVNTLDRLGASIGALQHFSGMLDGSAPRAAKKPSGAASNKPSSPSTAEAEAELEEDFDAFVPTHEDYAYDQSFGEIVHEELDLIYKTFRFVLREWWSMPQKWGRLLYYELGRVFYIWLGHPVNERPKYEWRKPLGREEL